MVAKNDGIQWLNDVADHDYDAAYGYLSMLLDERRANLAVGALKTETVVTRRANDILRACRLDPLPRSDPGVQRNFMKYREGHPLSPVLVVSFEYSGDIADGYHRVSLAYSVDPFAQVPLRLAHVPGLKKENY